MEFEHTKVFSTKEEKEKILELSKIAHNTPVIYFGGPDTKSAAEIAWKDLNKTVHKIALCHGLSDYKGYYGYDPTTMEFLKTPSN